MGEQVEKAFQNLGVVLQAAGLAASDVVKVNYYTTDVDELIAVLGPLASGFFGGNIPASTLLGVARLAFPQLKIEIEATAAR
jgi:enamine deaminase RidA (YjgF/YER057c/UK114 family)